MKLNPPDTAPKDGSMILASIGWPWLIPAIWNEHDEEWVCAIVQASTMVGGKLDSWYENEREPHKSLIGWLPIPQMPKASKNNLTKRKTSNS